MKPLAWSVFAWLLFAPDGAAAAEVCTGTITSLPATISTPGVWCLAGDLGTGLASGNAIRLATHHTTLDCQGFRISGLAAGPDTSAVGVAVINKQGTVIRDCNIRGFHTGIAITGGQPGHVVEDNRLDGATVRGILVDAPASTVRRNRVLDVGGSTSEPGAAWGIVATGQVDVVGNDVDGVDALLSDESAAGTGVLVQDDPLADIARNRIRRILGAGAGTGIGVRVLGGTGVVVRDNVIGDVGIGVQCADADSVAVGNDIAFATTAVAGCRDDGNLETP